MLGNYFKIAIRQLLRNRFYSLINVSGLAIGLSSCLLIVLYVQHELSYDQFHKNKDRIYRITEEFKTGDGVIATGLTPYKLAPDLKNKFPEILEVVRIDYDLEKYVIKYRNKKFLESSITSADTGFFNFFSFSLLKGNPQTVLIDPYTVAISDAQAKKYFAGEEPMGKILEFIDARSYKSFQAKVTGVFKAMPQNSHFHKDFILSKATADILIPERKEELGWTSHFSYLLLSPGADVAKLEKAVNHYIFRNYPKNITSWWSRFSLQSLNDIHLRSNLKEELEPNGDITYVYIFSGIAFFLILLASINYMNLATARAASRAKEVGIRKVVGAMKKQLIFQFLSESIIITFSALVLAILIARFSLPLFNGLSGKEITISFLNLKFVTIVIVITLVIGIFSGSYPAFFLSAIQPAKVLKGVFTKTGEKSLILRRGLVVLQFSISIILIIGTIVIYNQWNYLQTKKLGIDSGQVLIVHAETNKILSKYEPLKNELVQHPDIISVTASRKNLTSRFGNYTTVLLKGQEKGVSVPWTFVDPNFFKTFDIPIIKGSDFPQQSGKDSITDFILNESAAKLLGVTKSGTDMQALGRAGRITGIVKNFHFESLHAEISPTIFIPALTDLNYIAIRINTTNFKKTIKSVEQEFKRIDQEAIFEYSFLNDDIENLYKAEARFFGVFTTFSGLAIFIACLGIFGLAAFTASQRTKEIGIRKVLGASIQNISLLLTREFIKLVIMANLIAWPVAYILMQNWLKNFPYRIEPGIEMFLFAATIALLIATLTVSFQAIKTAIANPVKSLRTE